VVEDGVTGILVPPRDEDAIAAALWTLRGDAEARVTMGVTARQRAIERFDVRVTVQSYLKAYEIAGRHRRERGSVPT
jgi:N,N'-diacetylbacillosaminyl-diphospho-undecaprenol alpha-1,3-N-acetylgalactosaminyltransferase